MMKKLTIWFSRLKGNAVFQTTVGFMSLSIVAALIMLMFESNETQSGVDGFFHSLWFSIVTITAVGYGEIVPHSSFGKVAAIAIMLVGVVYITVIAGNITSWLVERNRKKVLGLVPIKKTEGHFLICGWKLGMSDLLKDILRLHKKSSSFLVLVNDANHQDVNELRQDPALRDLQFFSGDYTNTEVLMNACVHKAERVLILSGLYSGRSAEEIDFQAILATIAIKRIDPQIYSIVEIIQPKFSIYLQHIDVEEIILTRYSARAFICNIALMSGLNNIFNILFARGAGILKIRRIPSELFGRTYQELKKHTDQVIVLGVLENTGNLRINKQKKIEMIQKAVSIENSIQELAQIKRMESSLPIVHPPPNYILKEDSSIIILDVNPEELNQQYLAEMSEEEEKKNRTIEGRLWIQVNKFIEKADNWDHFTDQLKKVKVEIYQYQDIISGVIFNNQKYPFEVLGIAAEQVKRIHFLFDTKHTRQEWLLEKINEYLETASEWSDFYDLLKQAGMDIYLYRDRANGITYNHKKYRFKTLGVSEELSEEINQHRELYTDKPRTRKQHDPMDDSTHPTLSEFLNQLKRKKYLLGTELKKTSGILMICGWKPQLMEMIDFIISQYHHLAVEWNRIVVVADVDDVTSQRFFSHFGKTPMIRLHRGDFVDRHVLLEAEINRTTKVMILAETDSRKSYEEIDSQTVLAAMLIGGLNKRAYKIAEILDKRYEEALVQANVEEIYLEDEFSRIMLANGSHGVGIAKVLRELVNMDKTLLEIADIQEEYIGKSFGELSKDVYTPGKMVLGLLEETGTMHARKSEKIRQAQIQSNIKEQVEELKKVKELIPNKVNIAPEANHEINLNSKLVILNTNDYEGWKTFI